MKAYFVMLRQIKIILGNFCSKAWSLRDVQTVSKVSLLVLDTHRHQFLLLHTHTHRLNSVSVWAMILKQAAVLHSCIVAFLKPDLSEPCVVPTGCLATKTLNSVCSESAEWAALRGWPCLPQTLLFILQLCRKSRVWDATRLFPPMSPLEWNEAGVPQQSLCWEVISIFMLWTASKGAAWY